MLVRKGGKVRSPILCYDSISAFARLRHLAYFAESDSILDAGYE